MVRASMFQAARGEAIAGWLASRASRRRAFSGEEVDIDGAGRTSRAPKHLRTVRVGEIVATVSDPISPFLDALLPVPSRKLAAHANAVTCVLVGRTGPLRLECDGRRVDGDVLLVRPGVVHAVALAERGADVLYLNGLPFPFDAPLAQVLGGVLAHLASDALRGDRCATHELRARLTAPAPRLPSGIAEVVRAIYADPMQRMSQGELARRLVGANAGFAVFRPRRGKRSGTSRDGRRCNTRRS